MKFRACFFNTRSYVSQSPSEPMKKNHAFTLIELLVVISIIAILAGLALKAFGPAIERARATTDQNNLSSIGKGIRMFLNDNDDAMFSKDDKDAWPTVLQKKYVPDWKSFQSPFDKRPTYSGDKPAPISYGMNKAVLDTLLTKWDNSGSVVIMAAANVDTAVAGKKVQFVAVTASDGVDAPVIAKTPTGTDLGSHQNRQSIDVLFGDGHVEQMEWKKYIDTSTDVAKQHWSPMSTSTPP